MPFVYTLYYHGPWKTLSYLGRPRYKTLDVTKRSFYDKKNLCSWRVVPYTQIAANRQTGSRFAAKWCWDTGGLRNRLLRHGNAYRNSICKRLRKYSASVCEGGVVDVVKSTRFNLIRTTRHHKWRPVILDVICIRYDGLSFAVTSRSIWVESCRIVNICYTV